MSIAMQAMAAMTPTAILIEPAGEPATPSSIPARFGSMKLRLWPTMNVKEM